MNKIEVVSKSEIVSEIEGIVIEYSNDVLTLLVKDDLEEPVMFINNIYPNIKVIVDNNKTLTLLEIKGNKTTGNFNYKYILGNNSKIIINKFYYMNECTESIIVNLDGYASEVLLNLSVMSFSHQKYKP